MPKAVYNQTKHILIDSPCQDKIANPIQTNHMSSIYIYFQVNMTPRYPYILSQNLNTHCSRKSLCTNVLGIGFYFLELQIRWLVVTSYLCAAFSNRRERGFDTPRIDVDENHHGSCQVFRGIPARIITTSAFSSAVRTCSSPLYPVTSGQYFANLSDISTGKMQWHFYMPKKSSDVRAKIAVIFLQAKRSDISACQNTVTSMPYRPKIVVIFLQAKRSHVHAIHAKNCSVISTGKTQWYLCSTGKIADKVWRSYNSNLNIRKTSDLRGWLI